MNASTLRNLGIVLFALIVIMVALRFTDGGGDAPDLGGAFLEDLRPALNDVERVTVRRAGEDDVVVSRDGERWIVESRGGYAADVGKVRELLLALADAKVLEQKTSNPERYDALGVRDVSEEGSEGVLVTAEGGAGGFAVILGNTAQGSNRYARIDDEAGSVLIDKNPTVPETAGDWLDAEIVDIGASRIQRAEIAHADGETIAVSKSSSDATDFDVADIPDGRALSYPTVANSIGGALGSLELEDVREAEGGEPATVGTFRTFDGLDVIVNVFEAGEEERWIGLSASAADTTDSSSDDGEASDEGEEGAEENSADSDTAATDPTAEAEAINARTDGWEYKVADYKLNQLVRRWDDILAEVESADDADDE